MRIVDIQGTNVDAIPCPLIAVGLDTVSDGFELHKHSHHKCELIYTVKGLLTCEADGHIWTIPPQCALWIPSNVPHRSWAFGRIETYALFVDPRHLKHQRRFASAHGRCGYWSELERFSIS